ncbi:hypothetical protein GCM10027024_14830 [Microbacterium insulae]
MFPRQRIAVFIDGCFWHSCPLHGVSPATNSGYWRPKLAKNVARDHDTDQLLSAAGWTVIRIWEHVSPAEAANIIITAVRSHAPTRALGASRRSSER